MTKAMLLKQTQQIATQGKVTHLKEIASGDWHSERYVASAPVRHGNNTLQRN